MHTRPRILVVGSVVMDLIVSSERFPASGETVIGNDFKTAAGGKGANQAVQAARLGSEVTMVGKVGNDDFGSSILASVSESSVNIDHITISQNKPTAVGNVLLEIKDNSTANRIIVVPGANMDIKSDELTFLENTISQYDIVMLQLEIPMFINEQVARIAHQKGVRVMLNSAPSAPLSDELLSFLTYISPNEHEAYDLTGVQVKDEESAKQAINVLLQKGVKNVLITMGSKGAAFGNSEIFVASPCVDYGKVVDPTAAGDSFVAAFCTAVSLGVSYEEVLRFANFTASITVSRIGAQPSLPKIHEVLDFMKLQGYQTDAFDGLQ